MGLPYMVKQYLKENNVTDAGGFDIQRGSHNLSFYANPVMMATLMLTKDHETSTHKLYFSKTDFPSKFFVNCVKKNLNNIEDSIII